MNMALFKVSTHAAHWIITSMALQKRRQAALLTKPSSSPMPFGFEESEDDVVAPFTLQEEAMLREHHERRILNFVFKKRLPVKVGLTAVSYFKRFFVDRSVTAYNPSVIALSALYTSGKIEEIYIPVTELVYDFDHLVNNIKRGTSLEDEPYSEDDTAIRVSVDALLKTELAFLQQLDFHLIVFHALRSFGIVREFLRTAGAWPGDEDENGESSTLRQVAEYAEALLSTVIPVTDAILIYVPAFVSIAAAVIAAVNVKAESSEDEAVDFVLRATQKTETECRIQVIGAVTLIRAAIKKGVDDVEVIKQLEKRRRKISLRQNDPMCDEFVNSIGDNEEDDALTGKRPADAFADGIHDSDDEEFPPDKRLRTVA